MKPFAGIIVSESRSKAWKFMKLLKVTFTTPLDSTGAAAEAWNVQIHPTSYPIDDGGRMRYVGYGAVDWDSDEVIQCIEALLPGGKAVQQAASE